MAISDTLRRLQKEHGESNYRLAKEIGVSQTTVANWITGRRKPLKVYMQLLAEHYGISVEQLKEDAS